MELLKKTAQFRIDEQTKGVAADEVTDISLSGVPLLRDGLARFKALARLTLVALKPHITDLRAIGLDAFPALRTLDVCDNAIAVGSALPVCPSLRRLFISNNKITQWEELERLAAAFPSMEILDVTDNAADESSRFVEMFDLFPNLCALNSKTRDGTEVAVADSDESGNSSDEEDDEESSEFSATESGENGSEDGHSPSGACSDGAPGESEPPLKQPRVD